MANSRAATGVCLEKDRKYRRFLSRTEGAPLGLKQANGFHQRNIHALFTLLQFTAVSCMRLPSLASTLASKCR